jgi:IS605 OrfB family transposase
MQALTNGSGKLLDLHAHTIQGVCKQYERNRKQHKKAWLKFRGRKSLGWVPFNTGHVRLKNGAFVFRGVRYEAMHMRDLPEGSTFGAGSFGQDRRGRWYINVPVEMPVAGEAHKGDPIGIDLGLKDFATLSNGEKIANLRHYRQHEQALAVAQRANKKRRVKAIAAKVAHCRKDHHHKISAKLAAAHSVIVIGNVSAKKLARTRMAKSVLDAGWSSFRTMVSYKSMRNGGTYVEADERYTSQSCSSCGSMPPERPKGIAGLAIREWECSACGEFHDRDINASKNILRVGMNTLVVGASE